MANFECKVVKIDAKENHPNADRLTLYKIGGYTCISNKLEDGSDRYNVGDLVVYIPENALLPDWLLKTMGFWNYEKDCGIFSGKNGNRVKPLKLRGIFSCGLIYPTQTIKEHDEGLSEDVVVSHGYTKDTKFVFAEGESYTRYIPAIESENVAEFLGITKYEQPIPASMAGEVFNCGKIFKSYDVEPIQKYPNVLIEGEEVVMESKIHGTNCRYLFSVNQFHSETFGKNNDIYISSKGLGDKGLAFKNNENNKNNCYIKTFFQNNIEEKVKNSSLYKDCMKENKPITLLGEVYGDGIQDLTYGLKNKNIDFVLFDVYIGDTLNGRFLNYDELKSFSDEINLKMVDILYRGPFSFEKVNEYTDGFDTFGSNPKQIREGIVIKPLNERFNDEIGRVMVKSVSQAYKLRKNGSEYN